MKIYYDLDLQSQVVQGTAANVKKPVLYYGTAPVWELVITAGGAAADLSGIAAWRASVDVDFSKDSSPVCRSLADRIDLRDAASGIVRVQLLTLTTEFLAALNREKQRNGYFELQALNGDGYAEFIIQIPVVLHAAVDPADAEAPDPVEMEQFVKRTEVEAMLSRPLEYEYSADGVEAHEGLRDGDVYFRVRHGSSGVPSEWQKIYYGPKGEPGTSDITSMPEFAELQNRVDALARSVSGAETELSAMIGG
ncbi:MAG: hypothetical protein J6S73_00030 [Lentisphaeria bacterium]|nr:hypothetical protein [Lentisphaeria bacterium]